MKLVIIIFRLLIVISAFVGTYQSWTFARPHDLIYFTNQSNLFIGVLYFWLAFADIFNCKKPSASLHAAVVFYIAITGLVANFVLDLSAIHYPLIIAPLTVNHFVHIITPVMAFIDFLLFAKHRQLKFKHAASWLVYPVVYFIVILILVAIIPSIGYPYPFIDHNLLGTKALLINVVKFAAAFYLLGLLIVLLDKYLPKFICIKNT
ncbi:MAG: Pr6Pr family membrane protein [Paludibacter sp.]|jgi:hypothetical protein|nr:Pr6Pr family membrane protein [Paludibacter sp.]